MKNEQFITMILQLKEEGVSYRKIAENSNISPSLFYYYLRTGKFPYERRIELAEKIKQVYGGLLDNE